MLQTIMDWKSWNEPVQVSSNVVWQLIQSVHCWLQLRDTFNTNVQSILCKRYYAYFNEIFAFFFHCFCESKLYIPSTRAHSQMEHYFFSYLLTWEVDLIEILEIMAQMWQYVIFLSLKPTKVTSDFILY